MDIIAHYRFSFEQIQVFGVSYKVTAGKSSGELALINGTTLSFKTILRVVDYMEMIY